MFQIRLTKIKIKKSNDLVIIQVQHPQENMRQHMWKAHIIDLEVEKEMIEQMCFEINVLQRIGEIKPLFHLLGEKVKETAKNR